VLCFAQVFCYLRMGGSLSRVTVLPLVEHASSKELLDAKARFATFDVKRAHCTRPEDEQRFLTCIDAGFGSHEPFNTLVRQIFNERSVEVNMADSACRNSDKSHSGVPGAFTDGRAGAEPEVVLLSHGSFIEWASRAPRPHMPREGCGKKRRHAPRASVS
jgi:hypothetical protein